MWKRYKEEYDAKVEENSRKLNYNDKKKKHKQTPFEHVVCAIWEFYPDLKEAKHDDYKHQSAIKLGKRCY